MTPFEKKLAATPRSEIPPDWREEMLAHAARPCRPQTKTSAGGLPAVLALLRCARAVFSFPHPAAWGALAVAWVAIVALNFSGPRGEELYAVTPREYRGRLPSTQEYLVYAGWQRNLLLSLTDESGIHIERRYVPLPRDL